MQKALTTAVESVHVSASSLHHIDTVNAIIGTDPRINPEYWSIVIAIAISGTSLRFYGCRLIYQVRSFTDQVLESSSVAPLQGCSNCIRIEFLNRLVKNIEKESLIQV